MSVATSLKFPKAKRIKKLYHFWLVVEPTHLKNYESKMGSSYSRSENTKSLKRPTRFENSKVRR